MVREQQRMTYGERLRELGLFSLKMKSYEEILLLSAMGRHREDGARLFSEMPCSRGRGNRHKVEHETFGCGMGKASLS